ncbi:MAG: NAD(P)-binding domain-containing protein, partial [Acidobacteria bacterium]|nr:NAD(P)-binding domain-containing protein [Acidobacteriota bacterium]
MKKSYLFITIAALLVLLWMSLQGGSAGLHVGGLSWRGWALVCALLLMLAAAFALFDAARARRLLKASAGRSFEAEELNTQLTKEDLELIKQIDVNGPDYPHPVIFPDRCIGCHACVEACPHDVLAIMNGIATVVARDQCMEDTACQVECPVNPKACVVVNTTKRIKSRPAPVRDAAFMTNVPGCYIIGDVSGTPLIKNAANEGADVIKHISHELRNGAPLEPKADADVAIIGIGPAGLSAAITAQQHQLNCVGIEQDTALSTIAAYPKGKYIFFKPDTMPARGSIAVEGLGEQREQILETWLGAMKTSGVVINEGESCKSIKRAEDGDYFIVQTERGVEKQKITYRPRRVVLALGTRGTPMRLRLPGEEMKVTRDGRTEDKVKYKLADPDAYQGKKIIVVGAGNSAIEAAVDLVARRQGDRISFR